MCSSDLSGSYHFVENFPARYIADLTDRPKLKRKLKVVCACGNGTAGAFAPRVLEAIGCEVVRLDCELDHTFPKYNPNPEDLEMLHAMRDEVLRTKADVGLGFDGDGDRCGVVDNHGEEIFADKVGVMLARDMSALPCSNKPKISRTFSGSIPIPVSATSITNHSLPVSSFSRQALM